jgi:hypothetical protein
MKLILNRFYKGPEYTIGRLYIDGKYFCDTLEDVDRGILQTMPLSKIAEMKIPGKTAIPRGIYPVSLDIQSPRFKKYKQYSFCDGYVPRILDIPGFDGILIHIGNYAKDTDGCILIGTNSSKGMVSNSTATFKKFYQELQIAANNDEQITIEIY